MKIYTKTGDTGETGLWGGGRVKKNHPRIEAYGTLDEMNSALGLAIALAGKKLPKELAEDLKGIQGALFRLGSELATAEGTKPAVDLVGPHDYEALEQAIDRLEAKNKPLKTFILPGGSPLAAGLHLARTICRRAERLLVALNGVRSETVVYLNRLSDYLFVAARAANRLAKIKDVPWVGRRL